MSEHPIQGLIDTAMNTIKEMIDGNTIIGEPIPVGESGVIIPVSKVSLGFASGGSDFPTKTPKQVFGGASGAGLSVSPVGFLVVNGDDVRLLEFTKKSDTTADRLVNMVPGVVDRVSGIVSKAAAKKEGGKGGPQPEKGAPDPTPMEGELRFPEF